jgi:hypothetical protein
LVQEASKRFVVGSRPAPFQEKRRGRFPSRRGPDVTSW